MICFKPDSVTCSSAAECSTVLPRRAMTIHRVLQALTAKEPPQAPDLFNHRHPTECFGRNNQHVRISLSLRRSQFSRSQDADGRRQLAEVRNIVYVEEVVQGE